MKIKELTYTLKKGLPGYSSVSAGMSVTVDEDEDLAKAWDFLKKEVNSQCNEDPSWLEKEAKKAG